MDYYQIQSDIINAQISSHKLAMVSVAWVRGLEARLTSPKNVNITVVGIIYSILYFSKVNQISIQFTITFR